MENTMCSKKQQVEYFSDILNILNEHCTEKEMILHLDSLINVTNDCHIVELALQIQKSILKDGFNKYKTYDFNCYLEIYNEIDVADRDFTTVLNILKLFFSISPDIHDCINNILDVILKDFDLYKFLCLYDRILDVCNDRKVSFKIMEKVELKLITSMNSDNFEIKNLTMKVILKHMELIKNTDILKLIWVDVKSNRSYDILCLLSEYYISDEKTSLNFPLLCDLSYWNFIQSGILNKNYIIRKQMLYILKRSIDTINSKSSCAMVHNDNVICSLLSYSSNDKKKFITTWEHFFILFETLEEKQSHIILPSFQLLDSLKNLNPIWLACIYEKMLGHENNNVLNFTIHNILKNHNSDSAYENDILTKIENSLVNSLNNMNLFESHSENIPETVQLLITFLNKLSAEQFSSFLDKCSQISWTTIPFYYICYSLSHTQRKQNCSGIAEATKELFDSSLQIQDVYIRSASQIHLIYFFTNINISTSTFFNVFPKILCVSKLSCEHSIWCVLVSWISTLNKSINSTTVIEFILKSNYENIRGLSLLLLLVLDAKIITIECIEDFFVNILKSFKNVNNRYITDCFQLEKYLVLIGTLLQVSQKRKCGVNHEIAKIFEIDASNLCNFIKRRINSVNEYSDVQSVDHCIHFLKYFLAHDILHKGCLNSIENILEISFQYLPLSNAKPITRYFSIYLLKTILQTSAYNSKITKLYPIINNLPLLNFDSEECNTRNVQMFRGKLASGFYECLNEVKAICLPHIKEENIDLKGTLVKISESLEIGGRSTVISAMKVMKIILPIAIDNNFWDDEIITFIDNCWFGCYELRKSDLFINSIQIFLEMLYTYENLNHENLFEICVKFAKKIYDTNQAVIELNHLLMKRLLYVIENSSNLMTYIPLCDIFVEGLLFGQTKKKEQRINIEINKSFQDFMNCNSNINDIRNTNDGLVQNENSAELIRLTTIKIICCLLDSDACDLFIEKILQKLLLKYDSTNKSRYFADSLCHLMKNRIVQALLLIQPKFSVDQNVMLIPWVFENLSKESHQISVRYLQEWLLVRLMSSSNNFTIDLKKPASIRIGSLMSFVTVMYHLMKILKDVNKIYETIATILPWTMGQHFNTRLYAQVVIKKLYELVLNETNSILPTAHLIIYDSIIISLEQGNAAKNANRLSNDFFFAIFDPIKHHSLEMIFYHFPRLTLMSNDLLHIKKFNFTSKNIPITNEDSAFDSYESSPWIKKNQISNNDFLNDDDNIIIQKKITPWRTMSLDFDILTPHEVSIDQTESKGLIVVASLIDRAPNLGGLCRTCEIFGVSQYVINSIKHTENKEFQTLSVSSEKWINILEVKAHELLLYLTNMKKLGYVIVGAEQASQSKTLSQVTFPKKTVLLLGNEKEGIPAPLLSLLDICVEIPQKGVIRSLNVHVTGALFIWEYTKQHT